MNDTHGSTLRERMMQILEQPAAPRFKPLNKVEPQQLRAGTLIALFVGCITAMWLAIHLLDHAEKPFRTVSVTNDVTPEVLK